ncbi:hypothetical protein CHCC14820_1454 [Bacillus paralicheniformis]|uniref:DNA double-strand break repair nuclease NurA n=1 Tax=Bacillus paralicheniformis TaxID=1648923 RepID=A0AAW6K7E9_9BACI|nr:DNA double-strand break repair nuclease NurA [Bacillus paralicheniformis]MDE1451888.1 DNA double-strand break repair nuclease NurA [Bacillus paralicheniformis]TWK51946.1 hypothetical protein CHCC20347_3246 [Bacillus paralicheniformis]TWM29598.1 hypothetical protein CHCC14820_1454 [Bacillus paralicheniformis]
MSYSSRYGRKPNEYASKSAHTMLINDSEMNEYLTDCNFPKEGAVIELPKENMLKVSLNETTIKYIVAVDGGYDTVSTNKNFPSATVSFFQFGALMFKIEDLKQIEQQAFIKPADMQKLKNIERIKLALPTRYVTYKKEKNLINSIRKTLYDFFMKKPKEENEKTSNFMKTLSWLVFSEYKTKKGDAHFKSYSLSSCPECGEKNILLKKENMSKDYTFLCNCGAEIYLVDVFRLHEAIDNELGAGGILGYVTNLLEQFVIIDLIRTIYYKNKLLLRETMFIKDGPLGFFGQTARMHKLFRDLFIFLLDEGVAINLVGVEKSGVFVEHADQIRGKLGKGECLLLGNDYIYGNILPSVDNDQPYAGTSYYSGKIIYRTDLDQMFVITIPTTSSEVYINPEKHFYINIDNILSHLPDLKCDMYDNALFPVAMANKLVSLSSHPSSTILETFLREKVNNK